MNSEPPLNEFEELLKPLYELLERLATELRNFRKRSEEGMQLLVALPTWQGVIERRLEGIPTSKEIEELREEVRRVRAALEALARLLNSQSND